MRLLANIVRGLRALFQKRASENEMDEELNGFVRASTEDKLGRGVPPEQAARAARVEMGSMNSVKHQIRSVGWEAGAEIFLRDLWHAMRTLLRSPGFTLVALLSLALGIGANTAIFTLVKQVLLQNLPVRNPEQLVSFGKSFGGGVLGGIDLGTADMFTYDFARQLEGQPGPFRGVAAYLSFSPKTSVRAADSEGAIQVGTNLVSGNFFGVLGAAPLLGRTISPFDAVNPHRSAVVVVSYRFWQQRLSSDPSVTGKTITINSTPFAVIGVMPPEFHGIREEMEPPDLWVPVTMIEEVLLEPDMLRPRSLYLLHMFARRDPQSSLAAEQNWINRQVRDYVRAGEGTKITAERQQEIERITVELTPAAHGISNLGQRYGDSLLLLMAVVAVVLLIACANLANFLLARAVSQRREIATRLALGSSRTRIIRQSLVEALLLSVCGGLLGLCIAFAFTRALISFVAQGSAYTPLNAQPDASVLIFTLCICILAGLLFGLAPALQVGRSSAGEALNANTRTLASAGGQGSRWWPKALVITQIMLCLLLLVCAGLFLRTLRNLQDQDFGFERTHLLIARLGAQSAGYKPEQAPGLNQRLLGRLSAIPGVRSAALSGAPPMSFSSWRSSISVSGYTPLPKEDMSSVLNRVSEKYFDTAGIRIVAGRGFTAADNAKGMRVAVVSESIARKYFPKGNAIGHTVKIDILEGSLQLQIVGIAKDTRYYGPRQQPPSIVYLPLAQVVDNKGQGIRDSFANTILLRTHGDPDAVVRDLRSAMASVDPNLPILEVRTMREQLESFMSNESLISRLTLIFGAVAVLLAAIGLFGVISFNVTRRTGEIGIRIALGASGTGVQWMILRESLVLLATGLVLGLPLTLYAMRLVRSQLYDLSPFDPTILSIAAAGIALVTVVSAWFPARRAAAVDPMTALRCE